MQTFFFLILTWKVLHVKSIGRSYSKKAIILLTINTIVLENCSWLVFQSINRENCSAQQMLPVQYLSLYLRYCF